MSCIECSLRPCRYSLVFPDTGINQLGISLWLFSSLLKSPSTPTICGRIEKRDFGQCASTKMLAIKDVSAADDLRFPRHNLCDKRFVTITFYINVFSNGHMVVNRQYTYTYSRYIIINERYTYPYDHFRITITDLLLLFYISE